MELAKAMRVKRQYVNAVANGRTNVSINRLQQFADALGVPLIALLEGCEELQHQSLCCPCCGARLRLVSDKQEK